MGGEEILGLVRMDSRRRRYPRIVLTEFEDARQAQRVCEFAGTKKGFDASVPGPSDDLVTVRVELRHIQMGMGIDDLHQDKVLAREAIPDLRRTLAIL
jgi:hypothetical protein